LLASGKVRRIEGELLALIVSGRLSTLAGRARAAQAFARIALLVEGTGAAGYLIRELVFRVGERLSNLGEPVFSVEEHLSNVGELHARRASVSTILSRGSGAGHPAGAARSVAPGS
jgi:hypothetical protein